MCHKSFDDKVKRARHERNCAQETRTRLTITVGNVKELRKNGRVWPTSKDIWQDFTNGKTIADCQECHDREWDTFRSLYRTAEKYLKMSKRGKGQDQFSSDSGPSEEIRIEALHAVVCVSL